MSAAVVTHFQGKVALVTGATSGIGRATAIAFGKADITPSLGHVRFTPGKRTSSAAVRRSA
jgi:hypothetical protein